MKVEKYAINWNFAYANEPDIQLFVDELPDHGDLVYEKKDDCYFAETEDGYVDFYYYSRPGDGFGGRHFNITVEDGDMLKKEVLIGPWSSRPSVMMEKGFTPCVEVTYIYEDENGQQHRVAGHATKDLLDRLCVQQKDMYGASVGLRMVSSSIDLDDELHFVMLWMANECVCQSIPDEAELNGNGRCKKCGHKVYVDRNGILIEEKERRRNE